MAPAVSARDAAPVLRLTIEIPGYYVEDIVDAEDPAEEVEIAMQLASEDVGVVFAHYSGDDPTLMVKAMDGRIVGYEVGR